jgi:DNA-binding SARP family transcriptional activator
MTTPPTEPTAAVPLLWFGALGPLECRWAGNRLSLGGAKQQMVLALLVLEANRVVSVDRLLDWVWEDEAEPRNAATLQVYVSNLRRELAAASDQLGRPLILTQRPGYELRLEREQSDLLQFEALRLDGEEARQHERLGPAAQAFRAALLCWRGEPFAGLPVDPGATTSLRLARAAIVERLAEVELAMGHHREVLPELQAWVADEPLNEALRAHLMIALYRSGRQAEALTVYQQGREQLVEQLGIDPSRDLRELEARILNQDPDLELVTRHGPIDRRPIDSGPSTEVRSSVLAHKAVLEYPGGRFVLDGPVTTIGRLADRDLTVDDGGVSRVHAEIRRIGSSFVIVDLGSANGTVVNGRRTVQQVLEDGDVVRLGAVELRFKMPDN